MFRPCTFLYSMYTCTILITVKPVLAICVHLYSHSQWIRFWISLLSEYFRSNKNENDGKYCYFRECKDKFQIRHKMILLIDMVNSWDKFETSWKFVSKLFKNVYLSSSQDLSQCLLLLDHHKPDWSSLSLSLLDWRVKRVCHECTCRSKYN